MTWKSKISVFFSILVLTTCGLNAQERLNRNKKEKGEGSRVGRQNFAALVPAVGNMILGEPTSSSIVASIILYKNNEGFIEYSTKSGRYDKKTPVFTGNDDDPVEITISGLKENSIYFYRLNIRKSEENEFKPFPESWFSTRKNNNTPFSFCVIGDSHPEREGKMFNSSVYKQVIEKIAQKRPDFCFLSGDDFSMDRLVNSGQANRENVEAVYKTQRFYLGNTGTNPPLFLVNGNHEQAAKYLLDGTADNIAVQAGLARKKFFPLPSPDGFYSGDKDTVRHIGFLKDYYAFEWGDALFVVIDPYWHSDIPVDNQPGDQGNKIRKNPWGITLGESQYRWLKQTLEGSRARYKFVFAHHVNGTGRGGVERAKYNEWGGYGQNGEWQFDQFRPGWELPIHQLMAKNKVTIFFQGHDHLFARQELDGVTYQTLPSPADDTFTAFNREAYKSGDILPNSGFLHVTVHPDEVKVEYVRTIDGTKTFIEVMRPFVYSIRKYTDDKEKK